MWEVSIHMQWNFSIKVSLQPLKGDFFNSSVYLQFIRWKTSQKWSAVPRPDFMQAEQKKLLKLSSCVYLIYSSPILTILTFWLQRWVCFSNRPSSYQFPLLPPVDTSAVTWNYYQMLQTVTWASPLFFPRQLPRGH